jgi:predicted SnoaL-like aldol condensation-catalyzing enzyme
MYARLVLAAALLFAAFGAPLTASAQSASAADLERNKQVVIAFYVTTVNLRQPEAAVAQYVGPTYTQHNPGAADGKEAFIAFFTGFEQQFPDASLDIKRVIAEGDLVVTHSLFKVSPDDRGSAVVDIFRLKDGKVVEHWDVLQQVPETPANDNTMF